MKIKKYNNGAVEVFVVKQLEISHPFGGWSDDELSIAVEIDLDTLIDRHDYHDCPSSVTMYLDKDSLKDLQEVIEKLLKEMDAEK